MTAYGAFDSKTFRSFRLKTLITLLATFLLVTFLMPFSYMVVTSLKDKQQIIEGAQGSVLPLDTVTFNYQGKDYNVYNVPTSAGTRQLALIRKGQTESRFVDPAHPAADPVVWQGSWRTLEPVTVLNPRLTNFPEAWQRVQFPLLFFNTLMIAVFGMIGTLLSSICVAYAFTRFPIPGKNLIFMILIGTIILPRQVTLIPTFAFFTRIGWTGTWLPLIVPHFFSNAYNVFLLRQYFLTLPRELDEAAMIDGASPFRILRSVIIPQSYPVIIAVGLFHFVYAWNNYFEPLIYLIGKPNLVPLSVGIQIFNYQFGSEPQLIQATALLGMSLPVIIFFFAQRFFMQGIVVTGVEK